MKAAVISTPKATPLLGEAPIPTRTSKQETLVRIRAAALNPIDLHIAAGEHPLGTPAGAFVPGIEGVGIVEESDHFSPGTRIRVQVPGGFVSGTLGQFVVASNDACVVVPAGLTDVAAAAIGVVGVSAQLSSSRVSLADSDSVLILGATGGFGQAFQHVARAIGVNRIVGASRDPMRLSDRGFDGVVALAPDLPQQLEAIGGPVTVVIDPLWGKWASVGIASLANGGQYLSIGDIDAATSSIESRWFRHRSLSLLGFSGTYAAPTDNTAAYTAVATMAEAGHFTLETETYPIDDIATAWTRQHGSPAAKIVVTF